MKTNYERYMEYKISKIENKVSTKKLKKLNKSIESDLNFIKDVKKDFDAFAERCDKNNRYFRKAFVEKFQYLFNEFDDLFELDTKDIDTKERYIQLDECVNVCFECMKLYACCEMKP